MSKTFNTIKDGNVFDQVNCLNDNQNLIRLKLIEPRTRESS